MPAVVTPGDPISIEEYLAGEPGSEVRHEFINGQTYAMTGASRTHALIVNAIAYALTPAARRKSCQLFTSDMKVRLDIGGSTTFDYPDLFASGDPLDRETYFCRSPCVIVEVLSDSTARIDRREKLLAYQTLPSPRTYLLVEQDARRIEVYRRAGNWHVEYVERGEIALECLDTTLAVADIYADVERPAT